MELELPTIKECNNIIKKMRFLDIEEYSNKIRKEEKMRCPECKKYFFKDTLKTPSQICCSKECSKIRAKKQSKRWYKRIKRLPKNHPSKIKVKEWNHKKYLRNKEYYIIYHEIWAKKNPKKAKETHKKAMDKFIKTERFKELMKNYCRKNKQKMQSRWNTKLVLNHTLSKKVNLKKECKICKRKKELQLHHEIYPTRREEIRQAIKKGKIYYVCKKHHPRKRKKEIILKMPKWKKITKR